MHDTHHTKQFALLDKVLPECPSYQGICDGGPKHGEKLVSLFRRVTMPVIVREPNCIGSGYYKFVLEDQTWTWNGPAC